MNILNLQSLEATSEKVSVIDRFLSGSQTLKTETDTHSKFLDQEAGN